MEVRTSLKAAVLALTVVGIPAIVFAQNSINPKDFTTTIDNPFFPLVPNTTKVSATYVNLLFPRKTILCERY